MLTRALIRPKAKSEAEKPFWISYADLMTALMVLFLVVMVVSLLSFANAVSESEVLADKYNGFPFAAPNDLCLDGQGRIYFTSRPGVKMRTRAVCAGSSGGRTKVVSE